MENTAGSSQLEPPGTPAWKVEVPQQLRAQVRGVQAGSTQLGKIKGDISRHKKTSIQMLYSVLWSLQWIVWLPTYYCIVLKFAGVIQIWQLQGRGRGGGIIV